jgi:hypothetical protein
VTFEQSQPLQQTNLTQQIKLMVKSKNDKSHKRNSMGIPYFKGPHIKPKHISAGANMSVEVS